MKNILFLIFILRTFTFASEFNLKELKNIIDIENCELVNVKYSNIGSEPRQFMMNFVIDMNEKIKLSNGALYSHASSSGLETRTQNVFNSLSNNLFTNCSQKPNMKRVVSTLKEISLSHELIGLTHVIDQSVPYHILDMYTLLLENGDYLEINVDEGF